MLVPTGVVVILAYMAEVRCTCFMWTYLHESEIFAMFLSSRNNPTARVTAGVIDTLYDENLQPRFKHADVGRVLGIHNIKQHVGVISKGRFKPPHLAS